MRDPALVAVGPVVAENPVVGGISERNRRVVGEGWIVGGAATKRLPVKTLLTDVVWDRAVAGFDIGGPLAIGAQVGRETCKDAEVVAG